MAFLLSLAPNGRGTNNCGAVEFRMLAQLWERQQELREAIMAKSSHFTERSMLFGQFQILLSQAQSEPLRSRLDPMDRE